MNLPCCYTDDDYDCSNRRVDGLPMCERHLTRTIRQAIVERLIPDDVFAVLVKDTDEMARMKRIAREYEALEAVNDMHRSHRASLMTAAIESLPELRPEAVVYYVMLTGDRVKIGTTTNLKMRLASYRARPEDLLAVEAGGRDVERWRHAQFEHLQIGGREDFQMAPDLMEHISQIREDAPTTQDS